jgi:dihydropyrimidine dehydrogenase (NADP+)
VPFLTVDHHPFGSRWRQVAPRYGQHRFATASTEGRGETIGFTNIELISDRPLEDWLEDFKRLKEEFPDRMLIASIMEQYDKARWQELTRRIAECGVDGFECNFSCPHGHPERNMGAAMGQDPSMVEEVTGWVVEAANGIPVWAKMTPNIGDIREPARAAIKGGAVGIAAINTILSCTGVDLETLRPIPTVEGHATYGGAPCAYARPAHMRALGICALCAYARSAMYTSVLPGARLDASRAWALCVPPIPLMLVLIPAPQDTRTPR